MILLSRYDRLRIAPPAFWQGSGGPGDDECGCFVMKIKGGVIVTVIASVGDGWEHVSVSLKHRCPAWDEMEWVAQKFFGDQPAMQLHVAGDDHVNFHPYCLHWWRPIDGELPLPPGWMVGPKASRKREEA